MSAMFWTRKIPTIVGVVLTLLSSVSGAAQPPLQWSEHIRPGISEAALKAKLNNLGVQFDTAAGGLTYSSKVVAGERDYLFCKDRLYAIVEGVFVTGTEFNEWFQAFLAAHQRYGEPNEYYALKDWGQFRAEWNLDNGSTLYFQLQSNLKDKQGWSRQLYANEIGKPCL